MMEAAVKIVYLTISAGLIAVFASAAAASPQGGRPGQPPPLVSMTGGEPRQEVQPASDYLIGPEDVLGIVVWREPDMSGDVTVRPDGRITVPVLGEIVAEGKRPSRLQDELAAAAGKYVSGVNVVVIVRAINSRKIFVTGRVTSPGKYPLIGTLTVMQAIALAGGLTEFADPKAITILRSVEGKSQTLNFNYNAVSRGKNIEQNVLLKPGDTVVVP